MGQLLTRLSSRNEALLKAYIAGNLAKLFPSYKLASIGELLPGNRAVDLHLKDKDGNDVFVEVKASQIGKNQAGQIIDCYSSISNLEPEPKNFRLIVIGESIEERLKESLKALNISFISLDELGISLAELLEEERGKRRTLTPSEARLVLSLEAEEPNVIDAASVAKELRCTKNYARVLLHRLERKRWVERIAKGIYTYIPAAYGYEERFPPMNPLLIGSSLVVPYYFSYATANAHYGFTTQMPSTYYLATTKKRPAYQWRNISFRFVTLAKDKFFGFREEKALGFKVKMAEPEKAVVDSIDKIRYAGGIAELLEIVYRSWRRIDKGKLVDYALRMKTHSVCQRLGFILDLQAEKGLIKFPSNLRRRLLKGVGRSAVYLAPSRNKRGKLNTDWKVVRNLEDEQLLSELLTT